MQIISVQGRLCAKSTHIDSQLIRDVLTTLPVGIYIAMARANSIPPGLEIAVETRTVMVLRPTSQQPMLPTIRKQVTLPTIDKPCTTIRKATAVRVGLRLPCLPNLSKLLPFRHRSTQSVSSPHQ